MKKIVKRIVTTLVVLFALLGFGRTALAASGYINWNGTGAYESTVSGLEKIKTKGLSLKEERDTYKNAHDFLLNLSADQENIIKDKNNKLEAQRKEIEALKGAATNNGDQLKQAESDMKDVDQKTKEVLNSLN